MSPSPMRRVILLASLMVILATSPSTTRAANPGIEAGPAAAASLAVAISINGVVTGPGGAVAGAWIGIGTGHDWQETTTNASGQYNLVVDGDVGGHISYHVRPPIAARLAQINWATQIPSAAYAQNFTVVAGWLVELTIPPPAGQPAFEAHPLTHPLAEGRWWELDWGDAGMGQARAVLPPDAYHIIIRNTPPGTFITTLNADLRTADHLITQPLNTIWIPPFPTTPPNASLISFSALNGLGEAVITGAPGSALALAKVLLINVKTGHQAFVNSESDGSFSAQLFAPPGSHISIRHGPPNWHWQSVSSIGAEEGLNPFPAVVINRAHTHGAPSGWLPFASVGAVSFDWSQPMSIGAAWSLQGHMQSPPSIAPGDTLAITATMRIYGHAINANTDVGDIDVRGYVDLYMIYDAAGNPVQPKNYHGSSRLTPTGFPIIHEQWARLFVGDHAVTNLAYSGGNALSGTFAYTVTVPANLPYGVYRPVIYFGSENVPTTSTWAAAVIEPFTYQIEQAVLPPVKVATGAEGPPGTDRHLVARLLMDEPSQGQRGVGALDDSHLYGAGSFIVSQGAPYVIPAVDDESGAPIYYRLDPFLPMIGYTDRSTPASPLIPFALPGGELCMEIATPDGLFTNLGCEAIAQAGHHSPTSRGGQELNINSEQIKDIYRLRVASDNFVTSFDQYGRHEIIVTLELFDIWGNQYTGGGAYEVWVARPLDVTPGVLPGTPLAAGDAFNPALHFDPGVPADVHIDVTHYPFSDPAFKQTFSVAGTANRFGYFSSTDAFTLTQPGEYRVDIQTQYWDEAGELWMGAAAWGGIVMTPPGDAQLVAHGRRGMDSLPYVPNAWYTNCVTDPPAPTGFTSHLFNPYFNGDVVWSRAEYAQWDAWGLSCDGESLRLVASLQDKGVRIKPLIMARASEMGLQPLFYVPLAERYAADELPVFTSTNSRLPAHMVPGDEDMIAYAYFSSQRPGVRVRESVAEEGPTLLSGYWRLDTLYDRQQGVGVEGDLPTDFKFQYTGIVYRDLLTQVVEYVGHGSGWIHIDQDDPTGSRTMPPFAGPGNGGWTTDGGPLLTLKGEDIHQFIYLTGVMPGDVLDVGDRFHIAGHLMPTLPSRVRAIITRPNGIMTTVEGRANSIGYFYDHLQDFTANAPGLWTVDVTVWHDGEIGNGEMVDCNPAAPFNPAQPCPSGHVLGSVNGRFHVYVVPTASPLIVFLTPRPGFLDFYPGVSPVEFTGLVPAGWTNVTANYTIRMPGLLLDQDQVTPAGGQFAFTFDPGALNQDFPNLDLTARDDWRPGLSDTFTINVLLRGQMGGSAVFRAGSVTIQADEVFIKAGLLGTHTHLPMIVR